MKRLLRTGFYTLTTTVLVFAFLLTLLVYSEKFNQWLVIKLAEIVPGLSIDKADGLLLNEIHLQGLKYQFEQADISIQSATYQLDLTDLLNKQVRFKYLHLADVDVVLLQSDQPEEQDQDTGTFVMPVKLLLEDFNLNTLQVKQNDANYLIDSIKLALLYQGQQLQLSQFFLHSDLIRLQGDAGLQLESQLPFNVDLQLEKPVPDLADIKGRLQLQGDTRKISLHADILQPSEIHAQGWVEFAEEQAPRFNLSCDWSILQWPLQGEKQYASENSRLTLQGTVDDYSVDLESDIFAQDLVTGKLRLEGVGDGEQFTVNSLTLKGLEGDIQTSGRISWTENIPSQLQLLANDVQLSPALIGYSSELNLQADISGRLFKEPDLQINLTKLEGKVLDKPVNAKATINYSAEQLLIESLHAHVGANSLIAKGAVGVHNSLEFTLDAANLHELSSGLQGLAFAQGTVQGSMTSPIVQFEVLSDGLKFQQQQLGSLHAKGSLATEGEGQLDFSVNAEGLVINGTQIDKIELQSSGQFAQHNLRAIVDSKQGGGEMAVQGAWNPGAKNWHGEIQELKFQGTSAGSWQLIQAAPLEIKLGLQESTQLQTDLCLAQRSATGLLCLTAQLDQQQGQLFTGKVKQLPISAFADWLPDTLQVDSYLQAKFNLNYQEDLQGDIKINLDPGSVKIDHKLSGLQIVPFQASQFDAELSADSLHSNLDIIFNKVNHLKGKIQVAGLQNTDTANIDGLLNIQLEDISFMAAFIDSVSDVKGELNAKLVLQGLLSAPQLNGSKVRLAQAKLAVPEMGLRVNDINVELSHSEQQHIALNGSARIADKQIKIEGLIDQYISEQFKFQVAIKGEELQVMQVPEMQVWVTPDLRIEGDSRGAKLEGEVSIPKALLVFETLPAGAVALSEDEFIVTDKEIVEKAPRYPLDVDISILLGESVSLEGFGLKTHLQGQLRAEQKNNQLKLYNEINSVKGTYKAYGQDLTIERGQLIFSGDMENPGVNILASRKATDWEDKTIAYMRMTGTLKKPVMKVYTVPALSESEALAYLLTGAPLGKSDSSNASLIAAAAMGLGRDYIDALMGVVGIDEFDMKSTSVGQNSMVIGKRISSDLYARYIMDVLTAQMQFAVIYKLTKNISIETRAGSTYSSDIKYNIEFD